MSTPRDRDEHDQGNDDRDDDRDDRPRAPEPPERPHATRLIYGMQPAREAIAVHGAKLKRVLVEQRPREAEQFEAIARFARDRGAPVQRVDRGTLDRLAHG